MQYDYIAHTAKGQEAKNHKYYARVATGKKDKDGYNVYRYFYDKWDYDAYVSAKAKERSENIDKRAKFDKSEVYREYWDNPKDDMKLKNSFKNESKLERDVEYDIKEKQYDNELERIEKSAKIRKKASKASVEELIKKYTDKAISEDIDRKNKK